MKLKPSLREKKRYLVIKVISKEKFSYNVIKSALEEKMKEFLGTLLLSKASPILLKEKFNKENQTLIIKINNKYVNELKASLTLVKEVGDKKVIVKSVVCSGTLKKATTYLDK
jgi:RNase P/RNase MRP subunit POP5